MQGLTAALVAALLLPASAAAPASKAPLEVQARLAALEEMLAARPDGG